MDLPFISRQPVRQVTRSGRLRIAICRAGACFFDVEEHTIKIKRKIAP